MASSLFPRLLWSPGPQLGLSKASGLSKECVCSAKMRQIHVLKASEGWLTSAKGCGCSTLSTSSGFKSHSGLLARSQLWVAAGTALGEALVFALVPTVWRQARVPHQVSAKPRLCVELAVDMPCRPGPRLSPSPLRLRQCFWEEGDGLREVGLGSDRA